MPEQVVRMVRLSRTDRSVASEQLVGIGRVDPSTRPGRGAIRSGRSIDSVSSVEFLGRMSRVRSVLSVESIGRVWAVGHMKSFAREPSLNQSSCVGQFGRFAWSTGVGRSAWSVCVGTVRLIGLGKRFSRVVWVVRVPQASAGGVLVGRAK